MLTHALCAGLLYIDKTEEADSTHSITQLIAHVLFAYLEAGYDTPLLHACHVNARILGIDVHPRALVLIHHLQQHEEHTEEQAVRMKG